MIVEKLTNLFQWSLETNKQVVFKNIRIIS